MRRSSAKRSLMCVLTMSFSSIDAEHVRALGDDQRRRARAARLPRRARCTSASMRTALRHRPTLGWRRARPCAARGRDSVTPLMRVCAENGMIVNWPGSSAGGAMPNARFTSATMLLPSGVSSPSEASSVASASCCCGDARDRMERRGLPVAERDRAGLVEQQHVAVAGGLDRAARRRDDVGAHHPAHARRRRSPRAGRRSSSGSGSTSKRDKHGDRHRRAGLGDTSTAVDRVRQQRDGHQQKHQGQAASRIFRAISFGVFWRSAPSTSEIMRSRNAAPGLAVIRTII